MSDAPEVRFFKDPAGHNVAYAVHGEGPLVLCPTWWISNVEKDWTQAPFRTFFERLGRGLRVVRYDRPGVGLSDRKVPRRTYADEVELIAALVDELGVDTVSMFAVSCGGPLALAYAASHPDRVQRLCLYGSYARGADLGTVEVQTAMANLVRAHWGLGSRAMADIFLPDEPREAVDQLTAYQRDGAETGVAVELLELTYAMDASDHVGAVGADCLVLHRQGDRAVPHEAGRKLAAALDRARFVTMEGTAHPPWVGGAAVADLANGFFLGQSPDGRQTASDRPQPDPALDRANRRMVLGGAPVPLTPREYGVLSQLVDHENAVVTRDDLLAAVWKQQFEGSNKIDAVVRTLRKKLGDFAPSIETVIGHGYRFIGWRDRQAGDG